MALVPQPFVVQFQGGFDTKTAQKGVLPTKLTDLQNCVFYKNSSLIKRNGYKSLGQRIGNGSAVYTGAMGLVARDAELLLLNSDRAYSYRALQDRWYDTGEVCSTVATDIPVARTGTAQTTADHATNGSITVVAWEDNSSGVWCAVMDATDNSILSKQLLSSTGTRPRVIAVDTLLVVLYVTSFSTNSNLNVAIVNPANPTDTITSQVLTTDLDPVNPTYDACTMGGSLFSSNPGLAAWGTPNSIRVGYIHPSGVLGSPVTGLPTVASYTIADSGGSGLAPTGIAVTFDKTSHAGVGVAFGGVADCHAMVLNYTNLSTAIWSGTVATALGTIPRVACEFDNASNLWITAEVTGSANDRNTVYSAGVPIQGIASQPVVWAMGSNRALHGHGVVSRAFNDNGQVYVHVAHPVKFYPYVATVRVSTSTFGKTSTITVAHLLPMLSTGLPARPYWVASVNPVSPDTNFLSRQHVTALGYRIQLSSENGDQFGEAGIRLVTLDFNHTGAYSSAQLGRGLYLSGAVCNHYDGLRWAEAQFFTAPDRADGTPTWFTQGTGGSLSDGLYGYKFTYEEIDAQGEQHDSSASVELNVTVSAGGGTASMSIDVPTYRLTNKKSVRIGVWRSVANGSNAFYRVTSLDPTNTVGSNRYLANDPTVDSLTFVDAISDTVLLTKEPLYTNGGILDNDPGPMAGSMIAGGKGRLFYTDPSNPNIVRYTKTWKEDVGAEFSAELFVPMDPYGGQVVGLAIMDDNVLVFKETAVYTFTGPGPDDDGGETNPNHDFSTPQLLTSDVGCKAPNSISQTPIGVVFQTDKGIYIVDRGHQVRSIGDDAYAYNFQQIQRATLLPDRHQIVFLSDDPSGATLLYDYEHNQWSRFTNHFGMDAIVVGGAYYYLKTDGRVMKETPGSYSDDGAHIPMTIETAELKMAGYHQGWQKILRAQFLGEYKSPHTLLVSYALDYNDGYSAPFPINVDSTYNPNDYGEGLYGAGPYGGTTGPDVLYEESIHINKRCQSIRFKIQDQELYGNYGASFELSELLLTGGVIAPRFVPGATRSS